MLTLQAQKREESAKPKKIREQGLTPAVVYGPKTESIAIAVDQKALEKMWQDAGESTVFTLAIDGKDYDVLLHDIDLDPVKDTPIHCDFYAVDKTQKVEVDVELSFIGESPAVKTLNGTLVKVIHQLPVEGLPQNLPHEIEVNLEKLDTLESVITVADLSLPTGVEATIPETEVVVSVAEQKEEEEEAEPAEVDFSEIEVEKKGKKEEEGDEEKAAE